ncbi:MAG: SDR family NAD(P)-dependent oxidoreductase [Acidobacteriota bacterium]
MSDLTDSRVFITGASSGIGEALARELARRGAYVGLLARRDDRLRALAAELGERAGWRTADVTDETGFAAALEALREELGGVDIIVANAGYGMPEPPHRMRPGVSVPMVDTNYLGMLRMIDWALPQFLARGSGQIVGIASLASYVGMPNSATYCASKAAMRVHLQSLRVSLKPYDIEVTSICPGFVESELTAKNRARMPFLWPTDRAARTIADAIGRGSGEVTFPWQMALPIKLLMCLPAGLTEWIAGRIRPAVKPYRDPSGETATTE